MPYLQHGNASSYTIYSESCFNRKGLGSTKQPADVCACCAIRACMGSISEGRPQVGLKRRPPCNNPMALQAAVRQTAAQ